MVRHKLITGETIERVLDAKLALPGDSWNAIDTAFNASTIAYGSGVYVVLGNNTAYFSYDEGQTWDSAPLPALFVGPVDCVFIESIGLFVASCAQNRMAYSNDGSTWTLANAPLTSSWGVIIDAYDAEGKVYCYGMSGAFRLSSTDGINWTSSAHNAYGGLGWSDGVYANGKIVLLNSLTVGVPPYGGFYYGTDSINFSQVYPLPDNQTFQFYAVVYLNGAFIIAGDDCIMRSTDMVNWTRVSSIPGQWRSIAVDTARNRVIVTESNTAGKRVVKSEDGGINWTLVTTPETTFGKIIYNPDGGTRGLYMAVGQNKILTSN